MPVLPIQFGAGNGANGFAGSFQENFDMFAGSNECFANRGDVHHKMSGYRGEEALKSADVLYDNRAKLEFLRRNMDAFRRSSQLDLFGSNALVANKAEFFENLNRETNLLNMRHGAGIYESGPTINGREGREEEPLCEKSDSASKYYCYDNEDEHDIDESNDKIDVENEIDDVDLADVDTISDDRKCDGIKIKPLKPKLGGLDKSSDLIPPDQFQKKSFVPRDDCLPKIGERLSPVESTTEDNLILRVYSDLSPEHHIFSSSRSSNTSAEFLDPDGDKVQWQSSFPSRDAFAKKCFESTVLDYDFGAATQKKRKCGNAKGFSIENLIGSGNAT